MEGIATVVRELWAGWFFRLSHGLVRHCKTSQTCINTIVPIIPPWLAPDSRIAKNQSYNFFIIAAHYIDISLIEAQNQTYVPGPSCRSRHRPCRSWQLQWNLAYFNQKHKDVSSLIVCSEYVSIARRATHRPVTRDKAITPAIPSRLLCINSEEIMLPNRRSLLFCIMVI